jgi:hypothetical protein
MRKFFSIGDGIPLTTVTLAVLVPVLFALIVVVLEPVSEPSWWGDFIFNPARHAMLLFWSAVLLSSLIGLTGFRDRGTGEETSAPTQLGLVSDYFRVAAIGMLACLSIVAPEGLVGSDGDAAAYIAFGFMALGLALRWRDRRERRGFGRNEVSELG